MKTINQTQYVPKVSFLADEDMLKAYQEEIKSYSKRAREVLGVLAFEDGVIRGSNSFANVEIASLFPQEYRLALPSEVLHDSQSNPGFFRGNYEDLGLVVRTSTDSYHDYNARSLYKQLEYRKIKASEESPVLILLKGLSLKEDNESSYGLVHILTDEAQIIQAPELSHLNDGKKFSRVDERGIPIFDKEGERTFSARKGGLGGFVLVRGLGLDSYWSRGLSGFDASGRVAVVENLSSGNK